MIKNVNFLNLYVTLKDDNMKSIIDLFVEKLSEDEMKEIIRSFEKFEEDGYIGDEPIRQYTQKMISEYNLPTSTIVIWMNHLAFRVYKYFVDKYLKNEGGVL